MSTGDEPVVSPASNGGLPPPMRPLRCRNPDCTFPSGGRCAHAAEHDDPLVSCRDLLRAGTEVEVVDLATESAPAVSASVVSNQVEEARPTPGTPWTGQAFAAGEVDGLVLRSPARMVAVLGPHKAGKTCLLTAFFLELAQGQRCGFPYRFAGSQSLVGIQALFQRAAAWDGDPQREIVEYTKVMEGDSPRLFLHLGLRPEDGHDDRVVDLLLTDLPGEWIEGHAEKLDADANRRLGWLERADAFVVLADAIALAGPEATKLDQQTARILRRVKTVAAAGGRQQPVALVFTKFDGIIEGCEPPPASEAMRADRWGPLARARRTWASFQDALTAGLDVHPFAVSAFPWTVRGGHPVGVMEPFTWAMARLDRRTRWPSGGIDIPEGATSFQALRRWEGS